MAKPAVAAHRDWKAELQAQEAKNREAELRMKLMENHAMPSMMLGPSGTYPSLFSVNEQREMLNALETTQYLHHKAIFDEQAEEERKLQLLRESYRKTPQTTMLQPGEWVIPATKTDDGVRTQRIETCPGEFETLTYLGGRDDRPLAPHALYNKYIRNDPADWAAYEAGIDALLAAGMKTPSVFESPYPPAPQIKREIDWKRVNLRVAQLAVLLWIIATIVVSVVN